MIAGEASGDQLAAALLQGLKQYLPALSAYGIGGAAMCAQGFDARWPMEKLAVNGYAEVLRHLPALLWLRHRFGTQLLRQPPQLFVGVDAPDFNFGLEARLKWHGIRTAHFVSPSIWAWRRERLQKIKRAVDHMLVLFPFEEAIYQQAGIPVTYVGHPFADAIPLQADHSLARQKIGVADKTPLLAVLPGSRLSELHYIAAAFIAAMQRLHRLRPQLEFVVPMAGPLQMQQWRRLVEQGGARDLRIHLLERDSHTALAAADATLVASGTATLEAALFKQPMVIAYKMAPLTYRLMRNKGYLPYIGLPNILCQEFVVPEFIQDAATPEALAQAVLFQLEDANNRAQLQQRFTELHVRLRQGTAERASAALLPYLTS
ncbi:MAG: lipid-A-disaccharide synthase [Burkholderiaceae bacterium]|nr:MAG: lipid-A-disaccharide synthase [Burkholderiaceae bacterium]